MCVYEKLKIFFGFSERSCFDQFQYRQYHLSASLTIGGHRPMCMEHTAGRAAMAVAVHHRLGRGARRTTVKRAAAGRGEGVPAAKS